MLFKKSQNYNVLQLFCSAMFTQVFDLFPPPHLLNFKKEILLNFIFIASPPAEIPRLSSALPNVGGLGKNM